VAIAVDGEYAGDHDLALKRDGTVVAWGNNSSGQTNVPPDLTNVIAIAAGANHSLALRKDGTVVAWGANNAGQTNVPPGLSNVIAISGGGLSSVAIVLPPAEISRQAHPQHHLAVYALVSVIFLALVVSFWLRSRNAGSRIQSGE
jgi:alpha-tubulin suppressor-like RCC1 family protein